MREKEKMSFEAVSRFENEVANFYGSPYAVAVDSCTHGLELCIRLQGLDTITVPKRTYISVPFLADKLRIKLKWRDENWQDFYHLNENSRKIYDAAVLWEKDSYIENSFMCISFQYKKHLSLGRGGIILTDNKKDAILLKKMSYDGRIPEIPWREQDIDTFGYHYYMTPEVALLGLKKLPEAIKSIPKKWSVTDWPDLTNMEIFK
jgi:dTDP-4-amino-4,6-dideoxygalactose transaminase